MKIDLNAASISSFVEVYLLKHYDEHKAIPDFHVNWWRMGTSTYPRIALAAPRGCAKSTSMNHAFGLAAALFQQYPFQIKLSSKYDLACERIDAARIELAGNQALRQHFGVRSGKFKRDRQDDLIVECDNGYEFRMYAMGMDQAIRGITWGTMRPSLLIGDDVEDGDEILNPDYRTKVTNKINRVLLPMGGDNTKYIFIGTILHQASALAKMMRKKDSWHSARFEACDAEISEQSLLWKEKFPAEKLIEIRQTYLDDGDLVGFNMEYRNIAVDWQTSFFRPEDFVPMTDEDWKKPMIYYVGGDLAFTETDASNWTVMTVGGIDSDGILHIIDERRGRWDGKQVIDEMYRIEAFCRQMQEQNEQEREGVREWFLESGAIKKTLDTALQLRMPGEGYMNICPDLTPTKSKSVRATPLQARMRSKGVHWNTRASWFPDHQQELLEFTQEGTRGEYDDRVDADAWLGYGIKRMTTPPDVEEIERTELRSALRQAANDEMTEYETMTGYEFWRDAS